MGVSWVGCEGSKGGGVERLGVVGRITWGRGSRRYEDDAGDASGVKSE